MRAGLHLTLMVLMLLVGSRATLAAKLPKHPTLPVQRWYMQTGDTLKGALERWARRAGWSVQWQVAYDYPITMTACLTGSFPQVLEEVSRAYQNAEQPLYFNLYPRQRLVVITA